MKKYLLIVPLLLCFAGKANAFTLVQVKGAASTTLAVSSTAAGDAMLCALNGEANTNFTITSISDNQGTQYTTGTYYLSSNNAPITQMFYGLNVASGITSITVSKTGTFNFPSLICQEVSGIATSSALDVQSTGANSTGLTVSVTTAMTTNANDYLFGSAVTAANGQTWTGLSGFIVETSTASIILSPVTVHAATSTISTVSNLASYTGTNSLWAAAFGAFKATGVTPTCTPTSITLDTSTYSTTIGTPVSVTVTPVSTSTGAMCTSTLESNYSGSYLIIPTTGTKIDCQGATCAASATSTASTYSIGCDATGTYNLMGFLTSGSTSTVANSATSTLTCSAASTANSITTFLDQAAALIIRGASFIIHG